MNQIPDELLLYRSKLRDAVDRDLRANRRSRIAIRPRVAIPTLGVLAAATAAVVLGLTLTASPPSAYAAAKKALAATEAASSGTMTLGGGFGEITTEWNDGNIALTGGKVLSPLQQFLIVDGGVYVQQSDGSWLHYADADNVPAVLATRVRMARNNVAGNTADQVLALATGIEQTTQPDGTTVYTGTIPNSSVDPDTLLKPSDDLLMWAIISHRLGGPGDPTMQLRMVAGSDGTVQEVDLTRGDTLKFTYSDLGSTPPITAPANATDMAPGAVPPDFTNGGEVFAAK
jgi:hypothetical protein